MTEIKGKLILVRVSARFELARAQVVGKLYSLVKSVNVRNLSSFPLNKLKNINLVATATYNFMQKNDSNICFHWLGDIGRQKDVTL